MKRFVFCLFILAVAFCQSPLGIADGFESTEIGAIPEVPADITPDDVPTDTVPTDTAPADTASADTTQTEKASTETAKDSETAASAVEAGKEDGSGEDADVTFASIHSKGLAVADGNKWYYETFDRQGRSAFGVLYEDGAAIEKTVWTYHGAARYPEQKKILRKDASEVIRYNEKGKELTIERYEGKNLISKTENTYNDSDKLIEQTITAGKNSDRSVWEFAGDKAVTQTKYRDGKKTAFIELGSTPHSVHLYGDDKEVYVGEEQ